jgi:type I restriction enzyme S subunit
MNADRLLAHYAQIADAPDAIACLRRFILDLAVRGKLVMQDSTDEPASELLKRIADEKERLLKAGEIRKQKPLPDVEEPPFDLPRKWCWTRIREVATDRGQVTPQSTFTYIDVTAIDKEAGIVADPKVLEARDAPSRARKITRKGDVIYSCVRPYLLNVAIIEVDFSPQPIASTAFAILNGHGLVLPRYLWIVLRSPFMVACVEENQRGQAYPAINDTDFAVLPFPLPPLAEQHRIVVKFDELMGLCDRLEAARGNREAARDRLAAASLARLNGRDPKAFQPDARFALTALPALTTRPDQIKQLRQTILSLAVRGKLAPQDANDEPSSELLKRLGAQTNYRDLDVDHKLPTSWAWALIEDCFTVSGGMQKTPARTPKVNAFPYLGVGNVYRGRLDLANVKKFELVTGELERFRLEPEDILIVEGNGSATESDAAPSGMAKFRIVSTRTISFDVVPRSYS